MESQQLLSPLLITIVVVAKRYTMSKNNRKNTPKKTEAVTSLDTSAIFHETTLYTGEPFLHLIMKRREFIGIFQSTLRRVPLQEVINYWRDYERPKYRITYKQHINEMIKRSIFPEAFADGKPFETGAFKHLRWPATLNYINAQPDWTDEMRQEAADCYIEFAHWLSLFSFKDFIPEEIFHRNILPQIDNAPTFSDWRHFIEALGEQNKRDELIARTIIQGQRRISEMIELTINQIDFDTNTITFISKNKKEVVCYEKSFLEELKNYIQSTSKIRQNCPYVFVTRNGKKVTRRRLNYSFTHACEQNNIKKKFTPNTLRHLWVAFKNEKHRDSDIIESKEERVRKSKERRQIEVGNMLTNLQSPNDAEK